MNIPGYIGECKFGKPDGSTALNLLYHLLYSSEEELEFFITPCKSIIPTTIGDLTLGPFLGAGSFAAVYSDLDNQGKYVIKCIDHKQNFDRLVNEKDILKQLKDIEGVPRMMEFIKPTTVAERSIYAMKLEPYGVPVLTLISRVTSRRTFLLRMGIEILAILESVHKRNIVHRDIRCPNILVVPPENIRVSIATDKDNLGISKHISTIINSNFKFLLNDWGEAVRSNVRNLFAEDLKCLVKAVCKADYEDSSVPANKEKSVSRHFHKPPAPDFSEEEFMNLSAIAFTGSYNDLRAAFNSYNY
jgi:serine/threonine protein kinase